MALVTIEGYYENGSVQLTEQPEGVERAKVMVTFLPEGETNPSADERRAALQKRFIERLRRGVDFGTEPLPKREELYADRLRRF